MFLIVLGTTSAAAPAGPLGVVTLWSVRGTISGFAQDGDAIVWSSDTTGAAAQWCSRVQMRLLSSGRQRILGWETGFDPDAVDECYDSNLFIAASGTRAVWGGLVDCCNHPYGRVMSGGMAVRTSRLEEIGSDYGAVGDFIVDAAGDGETLAYATIVVVENDSDVCFPSFEPPPGNKKCLFRTSGGSVKKVVGDRGRRVPGVPPSIALDVFAGRLAIVPADQRFGRDFHARPNGAVEVRSAATGVASLRVHPRGEVTAIALSSTTVATLAVSSKSIWIEAFDANTGRRRARVRVPPRTAAHLDADGALVVFHSGKAIWALNAQTGRTSLLAVATTLPIGLSIEAGRVAWAEPGKKTSRIRGLQLRR